MKKYISMFFIVFFLFINIFFTYSLEYRVIKDSVGYPEYKHLPVTTIKKGTVVSHDNILENNYTNSFTATLLNDNPVLIIEDSETRLGVSLENLELMNCNIKLPEKILTVKENVFTKKAIPAYFLDVLQSNNPNYLKRYEILDGLCDLRYIAENLDCSSYFFAGITNIGICFRDFTDEIDFLDIKKVSETEYMCESIVIGKPDNFYSYDYDCDAFFNWHSMIFEKTPVGKTETVILTIDGDYLHVYNKTKDKPIITLAYVDDSVMEGLVDLFKNNKCDLSRINWPCHSDGSCDYTINKHSESSSNVAQFMRMNVKENLKLRSEESTSSKVLSVMKPGTEVRILEVGKAEKIDGINSNWIKVDVQFNPRGHTGEPLIPSMTGWCFGGYLE